MADPLSSIVQAVAPVATAELGSIIGGPAGAIVGALGTGLSDFLGLKDSRDHQMDLLNVQHQWAIEDWNRNNEYNSPKNQVKRLEEAGLNPLLATHEAGLSSAPSTAPSVPQSELSAMSSLITAQQQARLIDAQRKNIEADTDLKANNARIAENDADWREDMNQLSYIGKKADIDLTKTKMMESDANRAYAWKQCVYLDKSMDMLDSNMAINAVTIGKIQAEKSVSEQTARKIFLENLMKTETWQIQKDILVANLHMTEAQATSYLSQAVLCNNQAEAVNLANDFARQTIGYRVESERQKMRKSGFDAEVSNHQNQLLYWNANESRLNYQIDLETKQDLQYLGAFGTLIRCAGAVLK